ncbi:MAG: MFS transporter [Pseudomonadota bacterium]|nr:MFS transporter [Pseudomonadota bacterium]
MTEFVLTPAQRKRSITVVVVTVSVVALTLGLTWPLLSLILEAQGVSAMLIGLSSASQTVAVLVVLPLVPWMMSRFGTVPLVACAIATIIVALVLLPAFPNVYAWFPIRFLLGAAVEVLFIGCDVWVNQVAEEKSRGRVIGVYGFAMSAGFAGGPLIINMTGIEGWAPFLVGIVIIAVATIPLLWSRGVVPRIEGHPTGRLVYFLRIAPTLMIAGLMFGFVDAAALSFLPIYGLGYGYDQTTVVTMVTVIVVGMMLTQLPIGWLADHVGGRVMIVGATVLVAVPSALLPFIMDMPFAMWPALLVIGGALGGFYTIGMVMMGRRFKGADLVAVNAAFVVFWALGSIVGPAVTGVAIDATTVDAMPVVVVVACLLYLPLAIARMIKAGSE